MYNCIGVRETFFIAATTEDSRKQCRLEECKHFKKKTRHGGFFDYCCKEHANLDEERKSDIPVGKGNHF